MFTVSLLYFMRALEKIYYLIAISSSLVLHYRYVLSDYLLYAVLLKTGHFLVLSIEWLTSSCHLYAWMLFRHILLIAALSSVICSHKDISTIPALSILLFPLLGCRVVGFSEHHVIQPILIISRVWVIVSIRTVCHIKKINFWRKNVALLLSIILRSTVEAKTKVYNFRSVWTLFTLD